ncbi:MAG: DUF4911 domain-containing protein [Thermodesulfobacteriota bacterium]|nr:DUF4911 domain-containing protein [Thermodesulfobacteriota bacterium]
MAHAVETTKKYFRVDRREISFLKYVFEGWDNMAVLTTIDRDAGTVVLSIAPGCETDVTAVIERLKTEILMESITIPDTGGLKF